MNFKIKSLDHFLPSFLSKNGNFKTQDFSPLIKRVLDGVGPVQNDWYTTKMIWTVQNHFGPIEEKDINFLKYLKTHNTDLLSVE